MRSPLPGLVCVLVAAACSTEKPAAIPAPTTVSRDDVRVTEPRDSTLATTSDNTKAEEILKTGGAHDVSVTGESSVPNVKADHARS